MVMLRGESLPMFQGHCIDGAKTRVTITSDIDSVGRTVWQVGGQIAEDGVVWNERTLIAAAREELRSVLPGIDLSSVEWSTYRVDRAEGIVAGGKRPESIQIRRDGNCLTAWPTKLALVPQLATELVTAIEQFLPADGRRLMADGCRFNSLQKTEIGFRLSAIGCRPDVALPPWETAMQWVADRDVETVRPAKAA